MMPFATWGILVAVEDCHGAEMLISLRIYHLIKMPILVNASLDVVTGKTFSCENLGSLVG
jgi:hypothetical protein